MPCGHGPEGAVLIDKIPITGLVIVCSSKRTGSIHGWHTACTRYACWGVLMSGVGGIHGYMSSLDRKCYSHLIGFMVLLLITVSLGM